MIKTKIILLHFYFYLFIFTNFTIYKNSMGLTIFLFVLGASVWFYVCKCWRAYSWRNETSCSINMYWPRSSKKMYYHPREGILLLKLSAIWRLYCSSNNLVDRRQGHGRQEQGMIQLSSRWPASPTGTYIQMFYYYLRATHGWIIR